MADARKLARIQQGTEPTLVTVQERALKHVDSLFDAGSTEGAAPWAESSVRTRVSLSLVQASLAAERVKTMSQTPRELGVVVVHARLEDTPQNRVSWEAQARQLNEARAIEAVVVPKEQE